MLGRISLVLVAPLALAACGGDTPAQEEPGDISMGEAAEMAEGGGSKPRAGQYKVTIEIVEVNIPGAPAGTADMMKDMMAGRSHEYCLTQENVDKGFEEMAKQSQEGADCSFRRFDIDGGSFDAEMVCNVEGQGAMTMTMDGEGSATRSVMDMTMKGNMGGMGDMTMRMKSTHERIGDCS